VTQPAQTKKASIVRTLAWLFGVAMPLLAAASVIYENISGESLPLLGARLVLMIVGLLIVADLVFIPFPYSALGAMRRSPVPEGQPAVETSHRFFSSPWASVGTTLPLGGRCVQLRLYPSGLAVSFLFRTVFIAQSDFERVVAASSVPRVYHLYHRSPELRNPIGFNSAQLQDALAALLPERSGETDG